MLLRLRIADIALQVKLDGDAFDIQRKSFNAITALEEGAKERGNAAKYFFKCGEKFLIILILARREDSLDLTRRGAP